MSSRLLGPTDLDPLTGLPTREFLRQRLTEEYDKARELGGPLSLAAIDMDNFNDEINMRYSLIVGDRILREMPRLISSALPAGELLVRDGGDQFSVLLPGVNLDEACRVAETIRWAIAAPIQLQYQQRVFTVPVTASIGVATLTPEDVGAWALFVRARDAVHQAKDTGRNRVAWQEAHP